jgi:hypothetical protein
MACDIHGDADLNIRMYRRCNIYVSFQVPIRVNLLVTNYFTNYFIGKYELQFTGVGIDTELNIYKLESYFLYI